MNKLLVCAAALGLLVSVPASAQKDDHNGDKNGTAASHANHGSAPSGDNQNGKGSATTRQQGHAGIGNAPTTPVGVNQNVNKGTAAGPARTRSITTHQNMPAANNSAARYLPTSSDAHPSPQGRSTAVKGQNNTGGAGNTANHQPAANSRQGFTGSSGNAAGRQTDISAMRRNLQAPKHFHGGNYNAPQGYQYRHWSYGERLPRGYFVRDYWIGDFLMFGLFAPPSYLVWVRVGDDALLIDRDSGEIVQVRYGVFY
jgi:Ni/Co efflux regulator RcnB